MEEDLMCRPSSITLADDQTTHRYRAQSSSEKKDSGGDFEIFTPATSYYLVIVGDKGNLNNKFRNTVTYLIERSLRSIMTTVQEFERDHISFL